MEITSKSNAKIKQLKRLLSAAGERSKNGLFAVEGLRLCVDAVNAGFSPAAVYYTRDFASRRNQQLEILTLASREQYEVSGEAFDKLSDTVSPQGVLCVFDVPDCRLTIKKNGKYVVLCDVADPANLGAIARTACALAMDGMIVIGGCDIYNPKALRASMGAMFKLPVSAMSIDELFTTLQSNGIMTFATTPRATADDVDLLKFPDSFALFIGNEANGLSDAVIERCDKSVRIVTDENTESLNAAAAAAILIYKAVRQ